MLSKIFKVEKNTITIIAIMVVIVIVGITIAAIYYGNVNTSEDPRVLEVKKMYQRYDLLASESKHTQISSLLDSMTYIYNQYDDYKYSYEMGVVYNNKVAVLLTIALFEIQDNEQRDSILSLAKVDINTAINIYKNWITDFGSLTKEQIKARIEPIYVNNNSSLFEKDKIKLYVNKRINDILLAQKETPRRLSVSYTNLGIILRHQNKYEQAIVAYKKAIELWDNNLTAENNINILLGRPIKERSVLNKLFPNKK